jgi:hypothetical protein
MTALQNCLCCLPEPDVYNCILLPVRQKIYADSRVPARTYNMSLAVTDDQCISFLNGYDEMYLIPFLLDAEFNTRQDPRSHRALVLSF